MKLRIEQPLVQAAVSIDTTIAQKRPMGSLPIDRARFDLGADDFLPIDAALGDDLSVSTANKALPPKFNAIAPGRVFVTHPIGRGDETAVRNCVTALDRLPSRLLRRAELLFLARVPSNRCGIKNDLGTA